MKKEVQIYRCLFCHHETNELGVCPYCGSPAEFLVNPAEYYHHNLKYENLEEFEVDDLITTLRLEIANFEFYQEAEEWTDSEEWRSYFRYSRRHESYHRDEVGDILNVVDFGAIDYEELVLPDSNLEIFKKSIEVENNAIVLYEEFRERATNPILRDIYESLIQAELHHVDIYSFLDNMKQRRDMNG